ncbi:unnamed protein product [Blepharisma stoltei]|uniref:Uncharacterized protein n=1 Tax=Blepharisma stoltei TaxID=1481888 RepID=A0AAU9KCG2_9CILI|nr:unnamed protein product [Blepharisma stoltei]
MEQTKTQNKTISVENSSFLAKENKSSKPSLISPTPKIQITYDSNASFTDPRHSSYIKKLSSLLPKLTEQNKIKILFRLIEISETDRIKLNIPITLIKADNIPTPYLIKTNKNKRIISRQSHDDDFFDQFKQSNETPLFYYKDDSQSIVLSSIAEAKTLWNSSNHSAMIQQFIKPPNPASITRVVWKHNEKLKYFSIINLLKFQEKSSNINKQRYKYKAKKSQPQITEFKHINLMLKTSQSINNPFTSKKIERSPIVKVRNKTPLLRNSLDPEPNRLSLSASDEAISNGIKQNIFWTSSNEPKNFEAFTVQTKNENSCFAIQSKINIPEIEKMTNQLVSFLNNSEFKGKPIKGLVVDFMQNQDKNWIFLDIQEWTTIEKNELKVDENKWAKRRYSVESLNNIKKDQIAGLHIEADLENDANEDSDISDRQEKICSTPKKLFRIRSNSVHLRSEVIEKEILARDSKIAVSSLHNSHWSVNFKEQSNKTYNTIFKQRKNECPNVCSCLNKSACLEQSPSSRMFRNRKNESPTRKHFNKIISNYDAMKFNSKLSCLKNESLILKYGDNFWHEFTASLFDEILENDIIGYRFEDTNIENFTMIVDGLFRVFNGQAGLELRRKIRASHQHLGISEKEFDCFSDIFGRVLQSKIDSQDYQAIMSQINSMKCLICRMTNIKY